MKSNDERLNWYQRLKQFPAMYDHEIRLAMQTPEFRKVSERQGTWYDRCKSRRRIIKGQKDEKGIFNLDDSKKAE